MSHTLKFTPEARANLAYLRDTPSLEKRRKAVEKALALMAANIRHPGLRTHEYETLSRDFGQKVFEAYAEQDTPGAYRIFWHYGPDRGDITVIAITPHP